MEYRGTMSNETAPKFEIVTDRPLQTVGLQDYYITVQNEAAKLSFELKKQSEIAEEASLAPAVAQNDEDKALVLDIAGRLKGSNKNLDAIYEVLNRPLLNAQRLIRSIIDGAKKVTEPEIKRLEGISTNYRIAQEKLRQQEAAARQKVIDDEKARLAKIESDRIAEEQRIEAERQQALRDAEQAKSKKAREEAIARAEALAQQQEAAELSKDFEPAPAPVVLPTVSTVTKAEGAAVRTVINIDVVDITALYKSHPQFVKPLEPNLRAIQYHFNTPGVALDSLPGVIATRETVETVRAK